MKKNNKGITLIVLLLVIIILIMAVGVFWVHLENVFQLGKIAYQTVTKQINIEEEIHENEKLIGTADVSGEGIIIDILDGKDLIHQEDLIILIDELKNSGSQAISVNGQRITNTTYLYCDGTVILIDGVKIGNPFNIKAIGNKETIYGALTRNKGYIETLKRDGLEINIQKSDNVEIAKTNKTELLEEFENKNNISKLHELNKISGKSSMTGAGLRIIIQENSAKLTALSFIQIVNDLNSAGAEAISINGNRITNMTDMMDISSTYVLVNSIAIDAPFVIDVIGNQNKIEEVLDYDNSYITKIKSKGNNVYMSRVNNLRIEEYIKKKDQDKMLISYLK